MEKFNYLDFLQSVLPKPVDYSKMTEEELIAELQKCPDFDRLVFPNSFYSKHKLPEKKCLNTKEYIQESPWMKKSQYYYVGKQDIAAKPGGNRPVLPAPEVPTITLIENNFSDKDELKDQTETSNQPETLVS